MRQMEKERSLIENSIFNIIKTFFNLIFPVITFTYASRVLGDVGIGKVNFSKSIITYFTMLATLGMKYYGTREAAKLRDNRHDFSKFACEMLVINLMTTVISYTLLFIAMLSIPKLKDYKTLLLISSMAIALEGLGMEWLYQAIEEYRYIALRSILFQMIALVGMFIFVHDADDVMSYAAILLFAGSGSYILNFINARKYISFRYYDSFKLMYHIKPLARLFAMAVSIELYTVLDSTMLGFLQDDAAVGRYTAAVKVTRMVNSLITSIGVVLIPRLSYYIEQKKGEQVKKLVNKTYNFMFMLSIPAALGLYFLSDDIILLFCGNGFASATLTLRILAPTVIIIPFSVITNLQIFIPMTRENYILQSTLVGAAINFTLNQLLIPKLAENGAAVATVLAETAVTAVCFVNIGRFFDKKSIFKKYGQYWIAAISVPIIVIICDYMIIDRWLKMGVVIIASIICYFSILLIIRNPYFIMACDIIKGKLHFSQKSG